MKICDCCGSPAISKIVFCGNNAVDEQEFDVCMTHWETLIDLLRNPSGETDKKRGRAVKGQDNSVTS